MFTYHCTIITYKSVQFQLTIVGTYIYIFNMNWQNVYNIGKCYIGKTLLSSRNHSIFNYFTIHNIMHFISKYTIYVQERYNLYLHTFTFQVLTTTNNNSKILTYSIINGRFLSIYLCICNKISTVFGVSINIFVTSTKWFIKLTFNVLNSKMKISKNINN